MRDYDVSSIAMEEEELHQKQSLSLPETSSSSSSSSTSSPPQPLSSESEVEEDEESAFLSPPTTWRGGGGKRRILTKQLSMRETKMELKWEKRRRQMRLLRRGSGKSDGVALGGKEEEVVKGRPGRVRSLTDEDLDELRGSIDLGFGFSEEDGGHDLCRTLPALNLYFAVNRQLSDPKMRSPASTPTTTTSSASTLYGTPSPRSLNDQAQEDQQHHGNSNNLEADAWKIFNPGDSPQHVKTRLRHWAQIVACSVRQCC